LRNGDDTTDDRDDDVNQLLKLNVNCLYCDIDDITKFIIPGHNHKYTKIQLSTANIPSKYHQISHLVSNLEDTCLVIHS